MTMSLGLLKYAAESFIISLLPDDKARLINIDYKITMMSLALPAAAATRAHPGYIHEDIQYGNATRPLGRRRDEHDGPVANQGAQGNPAVH